MMRLILLVLISLLLTACFSVHRVSASMAHVQDLSFTDGPFFSEVGNKSTGKVYTGWSKKNHYDAKINAFRLCHADTKKINVCRSHKENQ